MSSHVQPVTQSQVLRAAQPATEIALFPPMPIDREPGLGGSVGYQHKCSSTLQGQLGPALASWPCYCLVCVAGVPLKRMLAMIMEPACGGVDKPLRGETVG